MAKGKILIGTCSWTDKSLIQCGRFYSPGVNTPEARLQFYASEFPIVEIDSSYYALPDPRTAGLWVARTPTGFLFNVKAFALFTHLPTKVNSLPRDLREELLTPLKEKANIYYRDTPNEIREELWRRFREALLPLESAGKLGVVVFQFPRWFLPGRDSRDHILICQEKLPQYRVTVEFRNTLWLGEKNREYTWDFLRRNNLSFVCVDEPQGFSSSVPPLAKATSEIALVRFHGRNRETWEKKGATASERFDYYYPEAELAEWVPKVRYLQEKAEEIHLLFNTNNQDQGIVNARLAARLFEEAPPDGSGGAPK